MNLIELEQGSEQWLEFRKNKIGASDAPIIMSASPWCTPTQLWERKMGFIPEQAESYAMSEGKLLEPIARKECERIIGQKLNPIVGQHSERDWQIASLDGINLEHTYAVEIKCPGVEDHYKASQGNVPEKYKYQLQHQMAVAELDFIYYFSFDKVAHNFGGSAPCNYLIEVKRDQEMIDKMLEAELKFYECMRTCTPPELTDRDYVNRNDSAWSLAAMAYLDAKDNLKNAELHEKKRRLDLIDCASWQNSKGYGVKVQKVTRSGAVQYDTIPALIGVNLDEYRKPASESWRITVDE